MRKALFLDRDGVINEDLGYTHRIAQFRFVDDIFSLCRYAQAKGYLIIVVTNQSGIARKLYTREQFKTLTRWITTQFYRRGIRIHSVEYCPHHPDITLKCSCRKPRPGMIHRAQRRYAINLQKSIMVGDKLSDMQAAQKAGIGTRLLLLQKTSSIKNAASEHLRPLTPKHWQSNCRLMRPALFGSRDFQNKHCFAGKEIQYPQNAKCRFEVITNLNQAIHKVK